MKNMRDFLLTTETMTILQYYDTTTHIYCRLKSETEITEYLQLPR